MNGNQVKKWLAIAFILCYVLLMVPLMVSSLHTWVMLGENRGFVTVAAVISRIIFSAFMLVALILLIYSDNLLYRLNKTRIDK